MSDAVLQRAVDLYKQGKTEQAAGLLSDLVKKEPKNASAWYGLAVCLDDPQQKRYCLQRTLSINPQHAQAQQMLESLAAGINPLAASAARSSTVTSESPKPSYTEPLRQELGLPSARATLRKPGTGRLRWIVLVLGGILLLGLTAATVVFGFRRINLAGSAGTATPTATRTSLISFPPTWTPAPSQTLQPYPTLKPSFTPLASSTPFVITTLTPLSAQEILAAQKTTLTPKPTPTPSFTCAVSPSILPSGEDTQITFTVTFTPPKAGQGFKIASLEPTFQGQKGCIANDGDGDGLASCTGRSGNLPAHKTITAVFITSGGMCYANYGTK